MTGNLRTRNDGACGARPKYRSGGECPGRKHDGRVCRKHGRRVRDGENPRCRRPNGFACEWRAGRRRGCSARPIPDEEEHVGISNYMVSGLFGAARELPRLREISSVLIRHGLGDLVAAPASLRCSSAQDRYCNGGRPATSRISNRSSARGSPWRNSGLLSLSWVRCSRQERIFCLQRGPKSSTGCTATWRRCRSTISSADRTVARPISI